MKELTLKEIVKAIKGKTSNRENPFFNKVFTDTREICKNQFNRNQSLFFALRGQNFDGHNFVNEAFRSGAKMAVVEYIPDNIGDIDKLIFVNDTLTALGNLAFYYKTFFDIPVVGITGSVGKTMTKEFTANVLLQKFKVHKTRGNLNSLVGMPLSIFEMQKSHEISVLELGSDHFGEIKKLTQICLPSIAVIISIGESHLKFFGDTMGVFREKIDIFRFSKKESIKIFNGNIKFMQEYKGSKNFISYGKASDNDFVISSIAFENGKYSFRLNGEKYSIFNNVKHNIFNVTPAIIIGKHYGLTYNEIQKGLLEKPEVNLRMEILKNKKHNWIIIADCYNANPQSMRSAINYLQNFPVLHKFAILGDMLELGKQRIILHKEIGKNLKRIKLDKIITIGDLSLNFNGNCHYQSVDAFFAKNENINFPQNSAILVKASRGMKLEKIVERLVY